MIFDDFDAEIQSDESSEGEFDGMCYHCGTDHSNPADKNYCMHYRDDEMSDNDPEDDDDDDI